MTRPLESDAPKKHQLRVRRLLRLPVQIEDVVPISAGAEYFTGVDLQQSRCHIQIANFIYSPLLTSELTMFPPLVTVKM